MSRAEREFLLGFEKAAVLTRRVLDCPPRFTTPDDYMASVAHLHEASDDLMSRGLAVGCLAAFGRDRSAA